MLYKIGLVSNDEAFRKVVELNVQSIFPMSNGFFDVFPSSEQLEDPSFNRDMYACLIVDLDLERAKDVVKPISEDCEHLDIIFISNDLHDSYKIYDVNHIAFVYKNDVGTYLKTALCKVRDNLYQAGNEFLKIRWKNTIYMVSMNEIAYIERDRRKSYIYTVNNEVYSTYMKMDEIIENLNSSFLRIHFSYVVNTSYVKEFHRDHVVLYKNQFIPISRTFSNNVKEFLSVVEE